MTEHDSSPPTVDEATARLIRSARPTSFSAGFGDRVAARLTAEREQAITHSLERQFIRIVPLVAAASLVLAAYNWWGARGTSLSPIDAALNLPAITLSVAYSPSSLFGASGASVDMP
jgi:hypothetical protein